MHQVVRLAQILPCDRGEDEPTRDTSGLRVERDLLAGREDLRRLVRQRRLLRGTGVPEVRDREGDDPRREDEARQERDLSVRARAHVTYDGLDVVQLDKG